MTSGYRHYSGLITAGKCVRMVGKDPSIYPYTDLSTAISACEKDDILIIDEGTYSLTETASFTDNITVYGRGRVNVNGGTAGILDRLVMINKPAGNTGAITYIDFHNIYFSNAYTGADVIEIDNDGGDTGALKVKFIDCSFDSTSGVSFDIDQTTSAIEEHVYIKGQHSADFVMDGCNWSLSGAGSSVHLEGYDIGAGVITLGAIDSVAVIYTLMNCQYTSAAAVVGGGDTAILNVQNTMQVTAAALVAPVIEDFDTSCASENVKTGVLDT